MKSAPDCRETEINQNSALVLRIKQQIARLDITMDKATPVQLHHRVKGTQHVAFQFLNVCWTKRARLIVDLVKAKQRAVDKLLCECYLGESVIAFQRLENGYFTSSLPFVLDYLEDKTGVAGGGENPILRCQGDLKLFALPDEEELLPREG